MASFPIIPPPSKAKLIEFHLKHFPGVLLPPGFTSAAPTPAKPAEVRVPKKRKREEQDEDPDGLGWYPDGVKRTLTDEDVAYFRQVEINKLLKERRHRQEAEAEKAQNEPPLEQNDEDGDKKPTNEAPAEGEIESATNWTPFGQRSSGAKKSPVEQFTSPKPEHLPFWKSKKKRKKEKHVPSPCDVPEEEESITQRRHARDQDDRKAPYVELDY